MVEFESRNFEGVQVTEEKRENTVTTWRLLDTYLWAQVTVLESTLASFFIRLVSVKFILNPLLISEQMEIKSLNDVTSLILKFGNDKFEPGRDPYLTIEGR